MKCKYCGGHHHHSWHKMHPTQRSALGKVAKVNSASALRGFKNQAKEAKVVG